MSGGRSETGVVIYENITATTAFAHRLGVPLVSVNLGTGASQTFVDFSSGKLQPPLPYIANETYVRHTHDYQASRPETELILYPSV